MGYYAGKALIKGNAITVISPVPLVQLAGSSSSLANGELVACGLLAAVLSCSK